MTFKCTESECMCLSTWFIYRVQLHFLISIVIYY